MQPTQNPIQLRVSLALIGALSGSFFWVLFEHLPEIVDNARIIMVMAAFAGSLSSSLLLLVGHMNLRRALPFATALATLASGLLLWASFRFELTDGFLNSAHGFGAFFYLSLLPLPFILAQNTAQKGWRDYEALFDQAWSIVVRSLTAWIFVGLFWGVVLISDSLLELVGFDYLGELVAKQWFAAPLTGLVLGLALAVLHELTTVVFTLRRLALALLRLLLPMVAVVIALFIVLVPFQGLGEVFGSLSAAGTMLAMAIGAVTLITSAVDGQDDHASNSRIMVISARVLSLLLPIITGIALYAIWLRVVQYGWTPPRLAGALVGALMMLYALGYGVSVISAPNWRKYIRRTNTLMALVLIGLSVFWLSPVLNAERISASSQVDRFMAGKTSVKELDIWRIGKDWGKAGTVALTALRHLTDNTELADKIAALDSGVDRWDFQRLGQKANTTDAQVELVSLLPVMRVQEALREAAFHAIRIEELHALLASCQKPLADGRPGCALIFGNLMPTDKEPSAILFWRRDVGTGTEGKILRWLSDENGYDGLNYWYTMDKNLWNQPAEVFIAQVLDGAFSFEPTGALQFQMGDVQIRAR